MKKHLLIGVACLLLSLNSIGQVSIIESFDSGTPAGWTDSYLNTTTQACAGNSERDNLWSGSSTGNMTSPNQVAASNGTDITFSIDYKVVDYSAATVATADGWGSADLQFSTDDGATWTTAITLDDTNDSNSNVCTTLSTTISGTLVATGSDLKFQVSNTWAAGDYYFYIDNFTATQVSANPPNCDAALTSATTDFPIDGTLTWSAASGAPTGYKISVGSSSGGTDIANNFDVGTATSYTPTGLGYDASYFVTITPYNTNGDATGCSEESFATEANPAADLTVNCGTPETESFCYDNLEDNTWLYTSDDGSSLKISFTAGGMEGCCDDIIIYDGSDNTAPVLYSGNNGGDLTGLEAASTGSSIFVAFDSDISVSCVSSGYVPADWSVECLSCTPGAGTASVGSCDAVNGIMLDVDVTNLGDGTIIIKNNIDATEITVNTTGVTAIGPFAFSSNVTVTLAHETDANCDVSLPAISLESGCPPTNDECSGAVVLTHEAEGSCTNTSSTLVNSTQSQAACAGSGENDVWFSFEATATSAIIDVTGGPDIVTEVFEEGSGCSALGASIICSDPNDPTVTGLTVGNTYYIRINVWSTFTTPSAFDICVTTPAEPPLNDDCVNAITLVCGDPAIDGTTVESVPEDSPIGCASDYGVWYTFVGDGNQNTITSETTFDHELEIFSTDSDCDGTFTTVICVDESTGTESHTFTSTVGVVYFVYVAHYSNFSSTTTGTFNIELTCVTPPLCEDPSGGLISNLTDTSVDIIWTASTNCISEEYWLLPTGDPEPIVGSGSPSDACGSVAVSGLDPETTYDLYVATTCSAGETLPVLLGSITTLPEPPDCAVSPILACGETINTGDLSGAGTWNPDGIDGFPGCYDTPGKEFVFQFVATLGGDYTLDIVLTENNFSWNDFYYRTDVVCAESGWTCLDDISGDATLSISGLTAGATVYVLVDSETTSAGQIHDVTLGCPLPPIANAGDIGSCQNADAVMVDGTNAKVNLLVGGEIIAAISSTEDLGMVDASYVRFDPTNNSTRDYTAQGDGDGLDMIDRSIIITPTNQPTGAVTVFLYYTTAEYDELLGNNDGDNAGAASWADLGITKFDTDVCAAMVDPNDMGGTLVTYVGATAVTGGWEVEITVSSFSGFQVAEANIALPIKLNRFTAKQDGRHNMIEWSTASEINVEDHTLMKSDDAINWEALGVVDGEITSNSNIDYEMMDVSPFATTYYQLMTTDIDGTTSYSPIVSVTRDSERSSEFLGVSPVPTRDIVNLNVYVSADDNITITLIDISGKKIFVDNRAISSGDHQLPLDLSNMTNGVYMVTITSSYIQQTHRVIKN